MNIKEAIERGLYPTDDKGRALVPTRSGDTATIYATDCPGCHCEVPQPIAGYADGAHTWGADGIFDPERPGCGYDLLPPPPRKVKVTRYGVLQKSGLIRSDDYFCATLESRDQAEDYARRRVGGDQWRIVELVGEYEEPWS